MAKVDVKVRSHTARNVGIVILLVIIVGAAAFYYLYLSGGVATLAYQAATNPQALQQAVLQKINSYPQLGVAYTGGIRYNSGAGYLLAASNYSTVTVSAYVPFNLSFAKYNSDERATVAVGRLTGPLSAASNLSVVGVSTNNGSTVYACFKFGAGTYRCARSSGSAFSVFKNITSSLGVPGSVSGFHASKVQPSFHNGVPCWELAGNATVYGSYASRNGTAKISFDACFSAQYYIPLTLNATVVPSTGGSLNVFLSETSITTATNDSAVTSLPGPISS